MILEHTIVRVRPGESAKFEAALTQAQAILREQPGFRRISLSKCIEESNQYLLLIEWDTLDDHIVRFRLSQDHFHWRKYLTHFWDPLPVTAHYRGVYAEHMLAKPSVLFVCVHNAGRSQMAAAFARHLSDGQVEVRSAGSAPTDCVHPAVRDAMLEVGIDISDETPKTLTTEAVQVSDVVITMGCGDSCPVYAGRKYLDWELPTPDGQQVESIRPIREEIRERVIDLLGDMGVSAASQKPTASVS